MNVRIKHHGFILIVMIFALSLFGCSPPQQPSVAVIVDNGGPAIGVKSHPKPGASVSLDNITPYVIKQAVPTDINLVLLVRDSNGLMNVHVGVSDELTLNSQQDYQFQLSADGRYDLPVTITGNIDGRYYINLHVATSVNGRQSSRVLSAIVQVGDQLTDLQKALPAGVNTDSDNVVSMPAQETIIP